MKFLLSPSQKLYLFNPKTSPNTLLLLPFKLVDNFIQNHHTLVLLSHKKLSIYSFIHQ